MKSRRWIAWGIAVYAAILVVVAGALTLLTNAARDRLDEALGERLRDTVTTAAALLSSDYGDSLLIWSVDTGYAATSLEFLWLTTRLDGLLRENELAELTLCDPDGRVLHSAAGRLERGAENVFWQLDPAAVAEAQEGFPSVSELYRHGDLFQKSAHAPLVTSGGLVAAILTADGNADFFTTLRSLRRGAWATGGAVVVLLFLLGLMLLRLQALAQRWRATVQRQENLAAMGRMTAGIAHEIRNPLGIISSTGQLLKKRMADEGIEDELVDFIPEEVERLDRILKGYLAFGSDTKAEKEIFDPVPILRRTTRLLYDELAATEVRAEVESPVGALKIHADPRRLQQVMLNLILNARDAMPGGGLIELRADPDGEVCLLQVVDGGTGLKGNAREKLFTPFWTTREKGSGLGLAMARRIAEDHGGSLDLRDRDDGRGAVAELRLPLAAADGDDKAEPMNEHPEE